MTTASSHTKGKTAKSQPRRRKDGSAHAALLLSRRWVHASAVAAGLLAALAASRVLWLPTPIYDDSIAVINGMTTGELPWRTLLTHDFWATDMVAAHSHRSWRPLTSTLYRLLNAVQRVVGPSNLFGHGLLVLRLASLGLYLACGFQIYRMLQALRRAAKLETRIDGPLFDSAALATVAWWLATPLHVETVRLILCRLGLKHCCGEEALAWD